jgi:hypothetical protein
MADRGITRNEIVTLLTRSEHSGKDVEALKVYLPTVQLAASNEPEFMARLIAWNEKNGSIRDSKIALPVSTLTVWSEGEFLENSLAHIALLDPRSLVKAFYFSKVVRPGGNNRRLVRLVEAYLRERERKRKWWDATALQHRKSLKALYALCHVKPSSRTNRILFDKNYKAGEVFDVVRNLPNMTPKEAAAAILNNEIPFMTAMGALGTRMKDPDLVLAMIERMTPNQLINSTQMLERLGVKTDAALRAAYEQGLQRVASSKKTNVFKTTKAAGALASEQLTDKLRATQEKQIDQMNKIKGRWAVFGDKSGSMEHSIESSRLIAATLARMVEDDVWLIFFDTEPSKVVNAKGKTYEELLNETKSVVANGGTSIGAPLMYLLERNIEVDGIAIVGDGAEHHAPLFRHVYTRYSQKFGKDVPVYLYDIPGEPSRDFLQDMKKAGHDIQVFDLRHGNIDYYALPNLVMTMTSKRYGLADQIMETPLLRLKDVLSDSAGIL